uniref:Uncharacterized protein n=1 Tax=Peronospora matthiolae TaxID=2874970 RepID=A0AAV1TEY3_9STRA
MRWISFFWVALTYSRGQSHGHLAIYRGYDATPPMPQRNMVHSMTHVRHAMVTAHRFQMQQVTTARRQLEALSTRLHVELQELLTTRQHAYEQIQEPRYPSKCECESASSSTTPLPAPVPAQPTESENAAGALLTGNASWQLEPVEPSMSSDNRLTGVDGRHQTDSFFASTLFALAVFFMAVPVACILGFVFFYRRRRRRQRKHYTHA